MSGPGNNKEITIRKDQLETQTGNGFKYLREGVGTS